MSPDSGLTPAPAQESPRGSRTALSDRAAARRARLPLRLETARRLELAVVNVIFRDDGYNLIAWKQHTRFGRESGVSFGNPDFVALAGAFGARGYRVGAARELRPALEAALAFSGPSIVDVPVDYSENARLMANMGQIVCPIL